MQHSYIIFTYQYKTFYVSSRFAHIIIFNVQIMKQIQNINVIEGIVMLLLHYKIIINNIKLTFMS